MNGRPHGWKHPVLPFAYSLLSSGFHDSCLELSSSVPIHTLTHRCLCPLKLTLLFSLALPCSLPAASHQIYYSATAFYSWSSHLGDTQVTHEVIPSHCVSWSVVWWCWSRVLHFSVLRCFLCVGKAALSLEGASALYCSSSLGRSRSHLGDLNVSALFAQILTSFPCYIAPSFFSLFCSCVFLLWTSGVELYSTFELGSGTALATPVMRCCC